MAHTHYVGTAKPASRRLRQVGVATLLGLLMAAQSPVMAAVTVSPGIAQGSLEVKALGTMESQAGESKVDFLKRVGQVLDVYTAATQTEACGVIGERPGRTEGEDGKWIVPLVTQESHMACVPVVTLPGDATYTQEGIHSHPDTPRGRFRATLPDVVLMKAIRAQRVHVGQWVSGNAYGAKAETFSAQDFAGGAGYLVARGQLLYQNGPRSVVSHGAVWKAGSDKTVVRGLGAYLPTLPLGMATMVDFGSLGVSVVEPSLPLPAVQTQLAGQPRP